jgi:hypothetical protein
MKAVDLRLRGMRPGSARHRILVFLGSATLSLLGCATLQDPDASRAARSSAEAALDLYEAGEYTLAAERFAQASRRAAAAGEATLQRNSVAGECLAWLHARRLPELAECSKRLERLQRGDRRPDPALNTLVALGAVAGDRALPDLRIPTSVRPLVQAAARGDR